MGGSPLVLDKAVLDQPTGSKPLRTKDSPFAQAEPSTYGLNTTELSKVLHAEQNHAVDR